MKKKIFITLLSLSSFFAIAQRNVMVIIADDLSTDYFGFYEDHQDTVDVPNIRYLKDHGVRFTNATSNPVCSATRASMLTGRYSFRTGVGGIIGGVGGSGTLDTNEITIPRLLKIYNPNIAKAHIGKWHLQQPSPPVNITAPNRMGYDHYEGGFTGQVTVSYTNWNKINDGVSSNCTNYATTEQSNNAISWLQSHNNTNPFFLWLAFNSPHEPLHLPPAGLHTFTNLSGTNGNINAFPKSYFKAMIQAMDHEIGRVFDSLRAINKFDSTDFIFMGDNGNTPRTAQISDTSRAKGTLYQYGVHVPLIISGPSVMNPGRTSTALVNLADIFATVLELHGYTNWGSQIPVNKAVDSKSILPIIKNQSDSIRPWVFSEIFKTTTDSCDGKAIRNKNYKLIRFNDGREAFYNVLQDPGELSNLTMNAMSSTDISNYSYLCNEMTHLIGNGNYCTASILPLNIFSLDAKLINKDVQLNWTTNNDLSTQYFAIEKSIDAKRFDSIGLVSFPSFTSSINTLQFYDRYVSNGINYYRLKVVNKDGGYIYSGTKVVNNVSNRNLDIVIVKNPVNNTLIIKVYKNEDTFRSLSIFDITGRLCLNIPYPNLNNSIDVAGFEKGVYFIQLSYNTTNKVINKLFIKN